MALAISVNDIHWPCVLSDTLKQQLLSIAQVENSLEVVGVSERKGPLRGVVYILQGVAGVSYCSGDMKNIMGGIFGSHDWIGIYVIGEYPELFVLTQELAPLSILFFPRLPIKRMAEQNDEVFKWLYHTTRTTQPKLLQATLSALHERSVKVVYTLLEIACRQKQIKGALLNLKVSQQQLSMVTGVSRPRVNEVLKQIEKAGEIKLLRGGIQLLDIQALGKRLDDMNTMFRDPREILRQAAPN